MFALGETQAALGVFRDYRDYKDYKDRKTLRLA